MPNLKSIKVYLTQDIYFEIYNDLSISKGLRDKIIQFISLLVRKYLFRYKNKRRFIYTNLSSLYLKRKFGDRYYFEIINYLAIRGYIFINQKYSNYEYNEYSKSYKLNAAFFENQLCGISIIARVKEIPPDFSLQPFLKEVTFDSSAQETLEKRLRRFRRPTRILAWNHNFDSMVARDFWVTTHRKTGRVFTNVTNLPKELRGHLVLRGEPTVDIDIKNSQPFLAARLYTTETDEKRRYLELVRSGLFYEAINDRLGIPYDLSKKGVRDRLKKRIFKEIFFGALNKSYEAMHIFAAMFPELFAVIKYMKRGGNKKRFPLFLQKTEADAMIGCVHAKAVEMDIPILTVHDSAIVRLRDQTLVAGWIREAFKNSVGVEPTLNIPQQDAQTTVNGAILEVSATTRPYRDLPANRMLPAVEQSAEASDAHRSSAGNSNNRFRMLECVDSPTSGSSVI